MNLLFLFCLGLVLHCTAGQMAHDVDILTELKQVQKECTNKFSELDEYKVRVLSLENTVKDLQGAVKDLERENKELVSEIHRMEDDKKPTAELNVNNFESKAERAVEVLQSVDDRRVLNATYPLQKNVDKSMKKDDDRIRSEIKRSFTMRPKPTNPALTNPGQAVDTHVAFTVTLSPIVVNLGAYETVVFDNVITNIGSAYQPNTGIFTAPLKGAYVFTLTMTAAPMQGLYLHIVKDGSYKYNIFADSHSKSALTSSTKEWILEVNKGSEVWIRCGYRGQPFGSDHTMWSGYLLFETN